MGRVAGRGRRRVGVHRLAEGAGGRTVVLCHPAPGSGSFDPDPAATQASGVTLIGLDRPGYGDSASVRSGDWATVHRAADDIAEVLDGLRADAVGVAGWGAGGRVALALAARRPGLVARVAVIGTHARDDAVPWLSPHQRALLEALRGEASFRAHRLIAHQFPRRLPDDPRDALALLGAADVEVGPEARVRLIEMLSAGYSAGPAGLAADIAGHCLRPWGFDPANVGTPTLLLYGVDDPVAGPEHGKWWLERLPAAEYEQVCGAGHLLVVPAWQRVLEFLFPV